MFFSIIIPIKKLTYHLLFENLPAFSKQLYKNFEVIVLPNEHAQYDLTLLKTYKWLKIIPTGKVTRPAQKRDVGVTESKGDILAFIDDDAYPKEDWLEKSVHIFKSNDVEAICGPGLLPKIVEKWEIIFNEVVKTFIGSGGYGYRFVKQKKRFVDDYPSMNFLIKKKTFIKLGGFDNDYWPGEDSKLCEDLVYKENGKILYIPDVVVYHHRRKDLKSYLKQHANYGFHRGAFFAHGDRNSRRISYVIPTLFLFYLIFLLFYLIFAFTFKLQSLNFNFLFSIVYVPIIFYLFSLLYLFFLSLINTKRLIIAVGSVIVLFLTHSVYGLMFVKGFIKGVINKKNIYT